MAEKTLPSAKYLMLTGIALIAFGAIAVVSPAVAGTAVVMIIGTVLLVSGIVQFVQGIREEALSSKLVAMILGIITALCGFAVLAHPLLGLSVLTLVLVIFFIVEGIWKIIASFSFRPASGWISMLISGLIALILAFLIWEQWPFSGMWAVGILVGADLFITGISMVMLAVGVRRLQASLTQLKIDL